jgi:hypothetical protein
MSTRQVTIAFESPVDIRHIAAIIQHYYPNTEVVIGYGLHVNGIHENWILVDDKSE